MAANQCTLLYVPPNHIVYISKVNRHLNESKIDYDDDNGNGDEEHESMSVCDIIYMSNEQIAHLYPASIYFNCVSNCLASDFVLFEYVCNVYHITIYFQILF